MGVNYYSSKPTPTHFWESKIDIEHAKIRHHDGKPYTVFVKSRGSEMLFIDFKKDGLGVTTRIYDSAGRQELLYAWNDLSTWEPGRELGTITLNQAAAWIYRDSDDSQWCRKASIYLKRDGRSIRRYFNHDTQQAENVIDPEGAVKHEITMPYPEFGEYDTFINAEIEPIFTWFNEFPDNVA